MPTSLGLRFDGCLWRRGFAPLSEPVRCSPHTFFLAFLALSLICISCSTVGSGSAPPPVTVIVKPNSAQPFIGSIVKFTAAVQNSSNSSVVWQVNGMTGGDSTHGTVDSNGQYTAPASVPNPPTVTVTAALQSNSAISGASSVTIRPLSPVIGSLVVSPALSSVTTSETLQFNILNPGISNSDVAWSVARTGGNGTSGTITPGGLYTPPGDAGADTVTATLPNAVGSATVEVTDFAGNLTWRNDNARSGTNSRELALAPSTVNSMTFGKLFSCPIDGYAYAQPLYVPNLPIPGNGTHNVVIVATERDSVFAFDADASSCKLLWQTSLAPAGSQPIETPNLQMSNANITPFVGITGTPVIGGNPLTLYVAAATQTVSANPVYSEQLHAVDLSSAPPPVQSEGIEIESPASLTPAFQPIQENQRAALLLDNGTVYVGFGSYGGPNAYWGWLFAYDSTSLQPTGALNVAGKTGSSGGGIWQSGGGPSADSSHDVFVATGDGLPNDGANYVDSFLRLGTNGGLSVADYFTPCDQGLGWGVNPAAVLQSESSAPVLLPDSAGSPTQPHLLIGGSKEGYLYVLNRDNMGQFQPEPCPDLPPRVQAVQTGGPILSTPLFWSDSVNNFVFVAPGNAKLMSFSMAGGVLSSAPASQSAETLGPQGATPVLSANGTRNPILWLIDTSGAFAATGSNASAILRAYDPENGLNEIYNSAMNASRDQAGVAVKFTVPTVANGKVYVGTQTELDVYGLLP